MDQLNSNRRLRMRLGGIAAAAIVLMGHTMVHASDVRDRSDDGLGPRAIAYHSSGVTYNGLHSTENPTNRQVAEDLKRVKKHFGVIRTYYAQFGGGAVDVGKVAADAGLNVLLGLFLFKDHPEWTANSYEQFVKPAIGRGNVIGLLIGNEDSDQLTTIKEYLTRAKSGFPRTPVSTSQTAGFWLSDPRAAELLPLVDFIAVNIYPAWDWQKADARNQPIGVTPKLGFESFRATYERVVAKYPGKQVIVTETGWPTSYGKIPSTQFPIGIRNARDYLQSVMRWAKNAKPPVNVYIYGMFDPLYGVGLGSLFNYHFGLIDSAGKTKEILF